MGHGGAADGTASFNDADVPAGRVLPAVVGQDPREITSSLAAARALLGVGQFEGLFSLATSRPSSAADVVDSAISTYELSDSDWETWAQAMASFPAIQQESIRNVAGAEILNHQNEPARERFWTIVYDSGAVHQ